MTTSIHLEPLTEAQIQKQIREYLTRLGMLVIRINLGKRGHIPFAFWQISPEMTYTSGISDLLAIDIDGHPFAIETKAPGEKPTSAQLQFQNEARKRGITCIVADSLDSLITQMETQYE